MSFVPLLAIGRIQYRSQVVDIWSIGVILHMLLHDGSTPHEYLVRRGRIRLMLGIADQRAMRSTGEIGWVSEAIPGPKGELLRDFFRSTQDACLAYEEHSRPLASALRTQLHDLSAALNDLDSSGSGAEVPRSVLLEHRPALKALLHMPGDESGDDRAESGIARNIKLNSCSIPAYIFWVSLLCLGAGAVVCIVVFGILQMHRKEAPRNAEPLSSPPNFTNPAAPALVVVSSLALPGVLPTSESTGSGEPEWSPSPNSGTPVGNKVVFPPPVPLTNHPAGDVNDRPPKDPTTSPTAPAVSTSLAPTIGKPGPPTSDPAPEQSTDGSPHPPWLQSTIYTLVFPDEADGRLPWELDGRADESLEKPSMDADGAELVLKFVNNMLEEVVSKGIEDYETKVASWLDGLVVEQFDPERYVLERMVTLLPREGEEGRRRGFVFVFAMVHDELFHTGTQFRIWLGLGAVFVEVFLTNYFFNS